MANKRVYFAVQQVGIAPDGALTTFDAIHGVQSVGMTTNFNLSTVLEIGQLSVYENVESIPDVQVSLTKVLDGYCPVYPLATKSAATPTLAARSNEKCFFGLSIFPDTNTSATGTPNSEVVCSGMFIGSASYNFPLDDNFSEEVTLVGNDKVWKNDPKYVGGPSAFQFAGQFAGNDSPIGTGGVNRRQDILFAPSASAGIDSNGMNKDYDCTILPPEVFGVTSSGTNIQTAGQYGAHLQSIKVSCDFGREAINELGRKGPYHRTVKFPVEVSTEIEVISPSGDMISATENGIYTTGAGACADIGNLKNRTIRIATCEGTRIYTGLKNKLSAVNMSGGDTGGSNVTVTYTFTTQNDFTVMHSGDTTVAWTTGNRALYLTN